MRLSIGVQWNVANNECSFSVFKKEKPPTKHGVLIIVSSVHDPSAFVAPLTQSAKLILQALWKRNISWDVEIDRE